MSIQFVKRELVAHAMHEAWSGWMEYLFSKCEIDSVTGRITIPKRYVKRWKRQMNTYYRDLKSSEKESDRIEADKILKLIDGD